jgi:hypothetical protein
MPIPKFMPDDEFLPFFNVYFFETLLVELDNNSFFLAVLLSAIEAEPF